MSDPLPAELGGRYQVVRRLGQGGMGAVYEAVDKASGQRVAVKVLMSDIARSQTLMGRFEREVRAVGELSTPHIVRVLGAGTDAPSGLPYMVMEYLDGEDLAEALRRTGPLPVEVALRIAAQACLALQTAHERRILHRDIKPANLFLARGDASRCTVKLLDFGVAKIKPEAAHANQETAGLTRTGSMLGSPLYMSPEQARGYKDIDFRSDLWSLGVVLYQMLAGRTPHADTEELGELLIVICTEAPEPLQEVAPWVPPEVASLVHRALRFSREERFPNAAEMLAAITQILPGGAIEIAEAAIRPLEEDEKRRVAPRLTESIHDAPAPRKGATVTGSGARSSPPISTLSSGAIVTGAPAPSVPAPAAAGARSRAPLIIAGLGFAALIAGLAGYRGTRPEPEKPAPASSAEPPPPVVTTAPAPPKLRTVKLVVIPRSASVTIDGAPVTATEGLVELEGALGSVHKVRIAAGGVEKAAEVVVTESGALPPVIEIAEAPAAVGRPPAGAKTAVPVKSASPVAPPPLRTDR